MEEQDVERFDSLELGLNLLEDDYLGGSGSRGYGRIEFRDFHIAIKTIDDYEESNEAEILYSGMLKDFAKEKESFFKKLEAKFKGAE